MEKPELTRKLEALDPAALAELSPISLPRELIAKAQQRSLWKRNVLIGSIALIAISGLGGLVVSRNSNPQPVLVTAGNSATPVPHSAESAHDQEGEYPPTNPVQSAHLPIYQRDADPMVTCGGLGLPFPVAQVHDHSSWEPVTEPWAVRWTSTVNDTDEFELADPDVGIDAWRQLRADGRHLLMAELATGQQIFYASRADGNTEGYGVCRPELVLQEGLHIVPFTSDPATPKPGQSELSVEVLLQETQGCGEGLEDRLRYIDIESSPEFLRVTLIAQQPPPPPPNWECEAGGEPPVPYTLVLPEPLAGRPILSGYTDTNY